ncbi:MAG: GIY-YIG nuclease family protein [Patescibacteria group bacterium]
MAKNIKEGNMNNHYYIYIVTNQRNTVLYTGVTGNLIVRIWEHKNKTGKVSYFTKKYNVDNLVYYEIGYSINDAIIREKQIKSWSKKRKIDLINKFNPDWKDLYIEMIA